MGHTRNYVPYNLVKHTILARKGIFPLEFGHVLEVPALILVDLEIVKRVRQKDVHIT